MHRPKSSSGTAPAAGTSYCGEVGIPEEFEPYGPSPFASAIGPLYRHRAKDSGVLGVLAGEQHVNTMGGVHGGLLLALVDTVLGNFVKMHIGAGVVAMTVDLNMSFLAGARPGQWIEVHPEIERKGQTMAFTTAEVFADGSKIARASATFYLHRQNRNETGDRNG